jgi:hypothetical protein
MTSQVLQEVRYSLRLLTVTYTPVDRRLDGSYRTIQVKVSGRERYVARTRAGYRATP